MKHMASTGDATYSATKAGYTGRVVQAGSELMAKPAIKSEVLRVYHERMLTEALPAAFKMHLAMMQDEKTPHGARVALISETYKQTLGAADDAAASKEPSEMTYDELMASIQALQARASQIEEGAKDVTPSSAGVFE